MNDKVEVPFDYPVRVSLIDKATGRIVDESETTAELLGAHFTTLSIMFNALTMSGGVLWRHPQTGERYPSGLTFKTEIEHPDTHETVEVYLR